MNQNLTEVVFILDRSGSMEPLTEEAIGGFNSLIEKQKGEEGDAAVTLVLFDDEYEVVYDHVPISEVKRLTKKEYYARGCTALLDAAGRTLTQVGKRLAETREEDRPGHIVVIITTDGYENASREYTKPQVRQMIETQRDVYKWKFMFLGANIDAVSEADSLGIRPCMTASYSPTSAGVGSTFRAMDKVIGFMRANDGTWDDEEEPCLFEEAMKEVK